MRNLKTKDDSDFEKKILEAFRNIIPNTLLPIGIGIIIITLLTVLCFRRHYIDLDRFPSIVIREFPSVETHTSVQ